ncbi:hypothetical protein D915_004834 [Fasciola hepatica]|uniref:EF-hand domain-containing protein n=1 Tax=Fasciola hepatica TaxID=6192 RepID=A0A4E0RCW7_FASHE|nr:hypothetical protein D915_004834 [Fasciola hepatica]
MYMYILHIWHELTSMATTRQEYHKLAKAILRDLDTNKNGKISVREMIAENKDPQYVHFVLDIFERYDVDGDKELDLDEFRTYLENECRVK